MFFGVKLSITSFCFIHLKELATSFQKTGARASQGIRCLKFILNQSEDPKVENVLGEHTPSP